MAEDPDWTTWLDGHGGALLLLARQFTSGRADAEDVVQEAFLRFWRSRHRAEDATAYLYACVRHVAHELHRGRLRRRRREEAAAAPELLNDWFASSAERHERDTQIRDGLLSLPPEQREVVVMKIWGRLTFEQIARAINVSANTAASRYRYALEKLRAELAQERVS